MLCTLWVIFQILAVVVEGGVSSGSAEALASGGVNNNGGAAGNNANAGAQNGLPLNGEPLVVRLVQLGGSFFLQPIGNQAGQPLLQQLIPIGALQQPGAFLLGQTGGAQGALTQGGPVFAVLPQRVAGVNPQGALLTPGQVHLISLAGLSSPQQAGIAATGGQAAARLRFQRSVAARLRRTQAPVMKVMAAEEEEECSGMEPEEKQSK